MAVTFVRAYPPEATDRAWQKKKSFKDKLKAATKTGLGAALLSAETEWGRIDFERLDARSAGELKTIQDVADARGKADLHLKGQVAKATAALLAAAAKAGAASKNTALTPAAAAAAGVIQARLLEKARNLSQIKLADFDLKAQTLHAQRQLALGKVRPYFASIRHAAADVKKNPTVAEYDAGAATGLHHHIHGLNAALVIPQDRALSAWAAEHWKPLAADSYKPTKDAQVVGKVNQVLERLAELEQLVG